MTDNSKDYVTDTLKQYWSLEQIVDRLLLDKKISISSETIYRFILQDEVIDGNHNGLLRQVIPKTVKLDDIDPKTVAKATVLMNNRLRKCLGYKTPIRSFY